MRKVKAPPLPNTSTWQPRTIDTASSIQEALLSRCEAIEAELTVRIAHEKAAAIDGFDSGLSVEDIIRESLATILPIRYSVTSGLVVDSFGATSGDVDIAIFNQIWFPQIRPSATSVTRRRILPFEGIYAVGEVKQALTFSSLDKAMEKLVRCHRLKRHAVSRNRIAENREQSSCTHEIANPLYSFIVAGTSDDVQAMIERFVAVNRNLKRSDVIRALCVLGKGTITWAFKDETGVRPALFMSEDRKMPIFPAFFPVEDCRSSLFVLVENLMLHLYHSILGPEDVISRYGPKFKGVKIPSDLNIALVADDV
jgi:hypothetical protein